MTYLAVASFPYFTNIPEDVVVNTWHFTRLTAPAEGDFNNLRNDLGAFYQAIYSNTGPIGHAPWLRPLENTLTIYDLDDPIPRPPLFIAGMPMTLGTPTTSSVTPPEMAVCLSYQANAEAGTNQQRRRGRIFLGGLGNCVGAGTSSTFPGFSGSGRQTAVADAAEALMAAVASHDWLWVVHSRTVSGDAVVTNGWVDDELDTQRRRGRQALSRVLWP